MWARSTSKIYSGPSECRGWLLNVRSRARQLDRIVRAKPVGEAEPRSARSFRLDDKGEEVILFADHFDAAKLKGIVETSAAIGEEGFSHIPYWLLVVAGLGIFLGCVGKSAQFPLHVWLPDAMEGPTPVSALIHAATMVAAGVYLVGRCYPLFTPEARLIIAYTGGITLFVAATVALVMTDIKKVLAYSTVSQLGYMILALGVGGWAAGLFHLITHAFFKALLFLCSGSVIYGCHHEQEMGKMGGLFKKMPITAITMLVGVLAISGIPLFSGWYSKDAILRGCSRLRVHTPESSAALSVAAGNRGHHGVLYVPHVVHDLHRRSPRPSCSRTCS